MRTLTLLTAAISLVLSPVALAQQPSGEPPAAESPAIAPTINSISIVEVEELPEEVQSQIRQIEADRSDEDLAKLHKSIADVPELKSALDAKGFKPEQIIAASLSESGQLTLVTRKKAS